ncbi:MAG: hypothetical protein JWM57_2737 [Phycisphaerales bacterium]|nr:hypothetical protein [Phycisphaerales bacterium]
MQGVGLLALLLGVALIFYLMFAGGGKGSVGQALETKKQSEQQIYSSVGRDQNAKLASDSIQFDTNDKGVVIQAVTAGGAFDTKYGVRAGDVITEIGPLTVKDVAGDAKGALNLAFARNDTLMVLRSGQRITLPQATAPGYVVPPPQRTTPRSQLEGILKQKSDDVPTH